MLPKIGKKYYSTNAMLNFDGIMMVDDFFDANSMYGIVKIPLEDCENGIVCIWNEPFRTEFVEKFVEMFD